MWAGSALVAELNRAVPRRYVHGDPSAALGTAGADDPMIWYEGATRRWLHADERGSIIAVSDAAGNAYVYNSYDEYGRSANGITGRFGYTGQAWLPEVGLYYYKARMYNGSGRFMQFDPTGYADGLNPVTAPGNDPVNLVDPTGRSVTDRCVQGATCMPNDPATDGDDIVVTGTRNRFPCLACDAPPSLLESMPFGFGGGIGDGGERGAGAQGTYISAFKPAKKRKRPPPPKKQDWCGSTGSSWIPDKPGGRNVSEACRAHDICYGSSTSRYGCDLDFIANTYNLCRRSGGSNEGCSAIATTYFLGVRILGLIAYDGSGRIW